MPTIKIQCRICGDSVTVQYTENKLLSGQFVRSTVICNKCHDKRYPSRGWKSQGLDYKMTTRKPYKD